MRQHGTHGQTALSLDSNVRGGGRFSYNPGAMLPARAYTNGAEPQCASCGKTLLLMSGGPFLTCDAKVGKGAERRTCHTKHYVAIEHGVVAVSYVPRDLYDAAREATPARQLELLMRAGVVQAAHRAISEAYHGRDKDLAA